MALNDTGVPNGLVTEEQIAQMTGLDVSQVRLMISGNVPIPPHLQGVIPKPVTEVTGYVWKAEDVEGLEDKVREAKERQRVQIAEQLASAEQEPYRPEPSYADLTEPSTRVSESVFEFRAERDRERAAAEEKFGGDVDAAHDATLPVGRKKKAPGWLRGVRTAWDATTAPDPTIAVSPGSVDATARPAASSTSVVDGDGHVIVTSGSNSRRSRTEERESFAAQRAEERAERARAADEAKAAKRAEKDARRADAAAAKGDKPAKTPKAPKPGKTAKLSESFTAPIPGDGAPTTPMPAAPTAGFDDVIGGAGAPTVPLMENPSKADLKRAARDAKIAARADGKQVPLKKVLNQKVKPDPAAVKAAKVAEAAAKKADKEASKEAKVARTAAYKAALERWKQDVKVAKETGTRPPRKPKAPKNDTSKPKPIDVTNAVRALATMLENSPGELESVRVMAREYEGTQIGEAFRRIQYRISDSNASMVEAFAPEKVFPTEVHNMLAVGQKTIAPGPALRTAVKLMDASSDAKRKLKGEIMEPASVGILSLVALFATAYGVMPSFVEMYNSLEMEVPPVSAAILVMSDWTVWILGGAAILGAAYLGWYFAWGRKIDAWRTWLDAYSLHMPLMGKANMTQQTYQLLKVLSAYISVGAPEREALVDAAEATKNRAIRKHLLTTAELMMAGRRTFAATFDSDMFPSMARNILGIGEQAGRVQEAIVDLETVYEREAEVESAQAVARVSGTVAGISSLIFTVVVTMVTVPPLEMFGSTLSYGQ